MSKKSQKISKITLEIIKKIKEKKSCKKKCYPPILGGRDSTRALQSSSFKNPGGYPERDGRRTNEQTNKRTNKRRKSSRLILDSSVAVIPYMKTNA